MKKFVEVKEENSGFLALGGQIITLFCVNYIYTGKLIGVNDLYLELEDPAIVYETGAYDNKQWKDAQKLPHNICVMVQSIESFGIIK